MAKGSRSGTPVKLWENCFQTLLYSSFCLLVCVDHLLLPENKAISFHSDSSPLICIRIPARASRNPHRRPALSNPRGGVPAAGRLRPRVPQQPGGHPGRVCQPHDHLLPSRRGRQEPFSRPALHGHAVQRPLARLGPARRHRGTGTTLTQVVNMADVPRKAQYSHN